MIIIIVLIMVIILSLLVFVTFHYGANKHYRKYVFIDSGIENLNSVLLLVSLPEKAIAILCAVCTSIPLGYRDSFIHNSQH